MPLLDHVHGFDACDDGARTMKRLESEHRSHDAFDGAMFLLDEVVEVLRLAHLDVHAAVGILGSPAARFATYDRDIRLEYAHVPEPAYRTGRGAILERFLARPSICSVVQDLDVRRSWERYFRVDGDDGSRTVQATIQWIRDEFAAAAKRQARPGTARLVLLDVSRIPDVGAATPESDRPKPPVQKENAYARTEASQERQHEHDDLHLRSCQAVIGYQHSCDRRRHRPYAGPSRR